MSAEQRVHYIGNLEKHYRMVNKIKPLINLDARLKKFSSCPHLTQDVYIRLVLK